MPEASDPLRSVERSRSGFVLHFGESAARMYVRRGDKRLVEAALRDLGAVVVDELGARVDESQFVEELDPAYNKNVGPSGWRITYQAFAPLWFINWRIDRRMRQSSDGSGAD